MHSYNFIDRSNQRFGRLLVLSFSHRSRNGTYWMCQCDCGKVLSINIGDLTKKKHPQISCGCAKKEAQTKHNASYHPLFPIWSGMIARCYARNSPAYKNYGGRGVTIFQEWIDNPHQFFEYMGNRPSMSHTIDRIDNNGNYEPGNCKWSSKKEQGRNTRLNCLLTHDNKTMTIAEWAELRKISYYTLHERLKMGWPIERAIETPVRAYKKRMR